MDLQFKIQNESMILACLKNFGSYLKVGANVEPL